MKGVDILSTRHITNVKSMEHRCGASLREYPILKHVDIHMVKLELYAAYLHDAGAKKH